MKRKSLMVVLFILVLPMLAVGQGCFIVGPGPGPGDEPGDGPAGRGDIQVAWFLDAEGSCDSADTVEVTIRDASGQVSAQDKFDCENFRSTFRDLVEGSYNISIVGLDPTGTIVYEGTAAVNVVPDTVTDVTVNLDPS